MYEKCGLSRRHLYTKSTHSIVKLEQQHGCHQHVGSVESWKGRREAKTPRRAHASFLFLYEELCDPKHAGVCGRLHWCSSLAHIATADTCIVVFYSHGPICGRGEPPHQFCFCTKQHMIQNMLLCAAGCTGAAVLPMSQLLTLALWRFIHMGLSATGH